MQNSSAHVVKEAELLVFPPNIVVIFFDCLHLEPSLRPSAKILAQRIVRDPLQLRFYKRKYLQLF